MNTNSEATFGVYFPQILNKSLLFRRVFFYPISMFNIGLWIWLSKQNDQITNFFLLLDSFFLLRSFENENKYPIFGKQISNFPCATQSLIFPFPSLWMWMCVQCRVYRQLFQFISCFWWNICSRIVAITQYKKGSIYNSCQRKIQSNSISTYHIGLEISIHLVICIYFVHTHSRRCVTASHSFWWTNQTPGYSQPIAGPCTDLTFTKC